MSDCYPFDLAYLIVQADVVFEVVDVILFVLVFLHTSILILIFIIFHHFTFCIALCI